MSFFLPEGIFFNFSWKSNYLIYQVFIKFNRYISSNQFIELASPSHQISPHQHYIVFIIMITFNQLSCQRNCEFSTCS